MGFTPFAMEIEGAERYFVWQIVEGDFSAFIRQNQQSWVMPLSPLPIQYLRRLCHEPC